MTLKLAKAINVDLFSMHEDIKQCMFRKHLPLMALPSPNMVDHSRQLQGLLEVLCIGVKLG